MHRFRAPLFALFLVLLTGATRLPSLLHSRAIDDETVYSLVANEIIDGGRPYVDAVERKPPLLFWIYAAVFKVAGKYNWLALHCVAVVWVLATMMGLYLLGKRLFDASSGCWAALLYSIFQPWGHWKNLAFNGEVMMNLPLVWAWLLALRPNEKWRRVSLFCSGALLCLGFLIKQPAAIAAVPLGIFLLLNPGRAIKSRLVEASILTLGFATILIVAVVILRAQGILDEAIYWAVLNHSVPHVFWMRAAHTTIGFVLSCLPLLLGSVLACPLWASRRSERNAMIGWLVVSLLGLAAGARFYPHYYIQLILPLTLFASVWFRKLWSLSVVSRLAISTWLTATIVVFASIHGRGLLSRDDPNPAAGYAAEHTSSSDRIFVWGHAPDVYLDAHRRPACRYILTFPLTGYVFGGEVRGLDTRQRILPFAWANLEQDFARNTPALIIDEESDRKAEFPVRDFPVLAQLLEQKYQLVNRGNGYAIYQRR